MCFNILLCLLIFTYIIFSTCWLQMTDIFSSRRTCSVYDDNRHHFVPFLEGGLGGWPTFFRKSQIMDDDIPTTQNNVLDIFTFFFFLPANVQYFKLFSCMSTFFLGYIVLWVLEDVHHRVSKCDVRIRTVSLFSWEPKWHTSCTY